LLLYEPLLKKVLIIAACIIFPVAGFLGYNWWHARQKADPFQLIPESAAAVIETTEFYKNWDNLKASAFWQNLKVFPFVSRITEKMIFADSAAGGFQNLKSFFHGRKVISSLHVVGKREADYIFYIPVENDSDQEMINKIFVNLKGWKTDERNYEGIIIKELSNPAQKISFSIIRYRNLIIGSYTGFLIEDIIRIINQEATGKFLKNNPDVKNSAHTHSDTYIYINYKNIPAYVSLFGNIQTHDFLNTLDHLADHSVLDYKMAEKEILLDGFTYSKKDTHFLSIFAGQKPQNFNVKSFIPSNTGILYYYGFDDAVKLNESLTKFWQKHDPSLIEKRTRLNEQLGIDLNELYPEFGNEAAMCLINSSKSFQQQGKLLFIESVNPDKFFLKLNKFVTIMKDGRNDTLLYEKQGAHLIREMNIPELPSMLLGDLFSGFNECFYTRINNYIVFSNEAQNLRNLIINIDSENVWGKSAEIASFIDNHFSPSNVSLFINTPQAWKQLFNSSSPELKQSMQDNPEILKKISPVLFQFNVFQDKIYTNIVISHRLDKELQNDQFKYEKIKEIKVENGISSILKPPFSDNKNEILVQDSLNVLYLINKNGVQWKNDLEAPIASIIIYEDINKNGVRDFVFAAGNKIYSFDSAGKIMPGFPISLADSVTFSGLSLADYEGKGKFRIVANDVNGNVYIFDMKGKNLEDWNPRVLGKLTSPLNHIRIKGKDYFIAMKKDGAVLALNRRGGIYKGFPVILGKSVSSPLFIEKGSSPEKTFLSILTDDGVLTKINLPGEIIQKTSFSDGLSIKCRLLPDQTGSGFIVEAQTGNQLIFMNPSGSELFQANISETVYDISYYYFKGNNVLNIYAMENKKSSLYLFDDQWKIQWRQAKIPGRVEINEVDKKILLYKTRNNILEIGNIR
jgi:hypothetical protein